MDEVDPCTACDLIYSYLIERTDADDRSFLNAQLVAGVKSDDLQTSPFRDELDATLYAPSGPEAEHLTALLNYLRKE